MFIDLAPLMMTQGVRLLFATLISSPAPSYFVLPRARSCLPVAAIYFELVEQQQALLA